MAGGVFPLAIGTGYVFPKFTGILKKKEFFSPSPVEITAPFRYIYLHDLRPAKIKEWKETAEKGFAIQKYPGLNQLTIHS